jgi:hypothetical protein
LVQQEVRGKAVEVEELSSEEDDDAEVRKMVRELRAVAVAAAVAMTAKKMRTRRALNTTQAL